ncbi:chronophin [Halyomorpha halys]|uniref:chronophin n=1 Tax=Halyomorpha halys TaxID=286706 RepID=UPI0006D4F04F
MARNMINFSELNSEQLREFKDRYDAYIFDMDGCLVHLEGPPIQGVKEALAEISKNGKSIHVVTDNCLSTLKDISTRVNGLFPAIKKENVMSCGHLAVRYLKEVNFNKKVYVIGLEKGIVTELKDHGFHVLHDEEIVKLAIGDLRKIKFEDNVGAVVVAGDMNFNYMKMFKAANYLADPEVLLIQSHQPNIALFNPVTPAVGAIASAVKAGSGRNDSIGMGKGGEYCSKYLKSLGFPVERCLFVGDGLPNDIQAGNMSGMDTMLTLTGACNLKDVESAKAKNRVNHIPTYYINSVADLIKAFKTE